MTDLFQVALRVYQVCSEHDIPCCLIGGVALQARGEDRLTRDVDFSVLAGFDSAEFTIDLLLKRFEGRVANAREHAMRYRVLLLAVDGIGVDVGLAGFPYEEAAIRRATMEEISEGIILPVVSANDLIVMKAFAHRDQDWADIRGVIIRQQSKLNWDQILADLGPLVELLEKPEILEKLATIRSELAPR